MPAPAVWDKVLPALPATTISLVALGLSWAAFRYTRKKDATARRQSIEDDFWLRKVLAPLTIDPFLEFTQKLTRDLPAPDQEPPDALKEQWKQIVVELNHHASAFQLLDVVAPDVCQAVEREFEAMEDELGQYFGALMAPPAEGLPPLPSRPQALAKLRSAQRQVLLHIKRHQSTVA